MNGKTLFGSSRDLPSAINRHRAELRLGGHRKHELQADWDASGPDAFTFEILDTLSPNDQPDYDPKDDLEMLEKMWLQKLAPSGDPGY